LINAFYDISFKAFKTCGCNVAVVVAAVDFFGICENFTSVVVAVVVVVTRRNYLMQT